MTSDSEVEGDVVEDCSQICTNVIFSSCHDIQQNRHPLPKYLEAPPPVLESTGSDLVSCLRFIPLVLLVVIIVTVIISHIDIVLC